MTFQLDTSTTASTDETTTVNNTTSLDLQTSNIQFEIKNYTVLSHNASIPNTYSLRIRIKGYKWNNKYLNVTSQESRRLLQEKILPLLYKNLNLVPDEIKEVKLLKLFKGKRSSSVSLQEPTNLTDRTDNEDNDIVFDFKIIKIARKLSLTKSHIFHLFYSGTIVASAGPIDFNLLNNTLEQAFKQAVLKHFESRLSHIIVTTIVRKSEAENRFPIRFTLELTTSFIELLAEDVTKSLAEYAVNSQQCKLLNQSIKCTDESNDFDSLYRVSDLWIKLDKGESKEKKIMSIKELFAFNSAWVFGLIIIACILALFFFGCIFAICYTRKPYRKPSKVYDMESAVYNKINNHKPSMYPTTKKQIVPKHKEVYY